MNNRENYVLCNRDNASNTLYYHTGKAVANGSVYCGDVLEAKRFGSLAEAAAEIANNPGEFYLGVNIILISDATFAKLTESKAGDQVLYRKFHDPNYAIR